MGSRCFLQWRRWILGTILAIVSVMWVISPPILAFPNLEIHPIGSDVSTDAQGLLRQGILAYEAEHFTEAIAYWSSAITEFERQGDTLNPALLWSNLSLAYQQLGQWQEAESALSRSFALLSAESEVSPATQAILARALNTQGNLNWIQGQLEDALGSWQQATLTYAQTHDNRGIILSTINQSRALQALGLSTHAELALNQVNTFIQQQTLEPDLQAIGQWHLGNAHRRLGHLSMALSLLQESWAIAQTLPNANFKTSILLDLGNTERALYHHAVSVGQVNDAQTHYQQAIAYYQQAIDQSTNTTQQLPGQLNQLSLYRQAGAYDSAVQVWQEVSTALSNLPNGRSRIILTLNAVHNLSCLRRAIDADLPNCSEAYFIDNSQLNPDLEPLLPSWQAISQLIRQSIQEAQQLQDSRMASYALGQLGELYEWMGQWDDAQQLTAAALLEIEEVQAPDIRYRWEWQMGRLFEHQGERSLAIAAYTAAYHTLQSVRQDLLTIDSEVQFSFRDNIEPLYRNLVNLLLQSDAGQEPELANLNKAIEVMDQLQLAELENFLRCTIPSSDGQDTPSSLRLDLDRIDPTAVLIYPIILSDRLEVIVKFPGEPLQRFVSWVQQSVVEQILLELRANLMTRTHPEQLLAQSAQVYNWILRPLDAHLLRQPHLKTLVFVLDGMLRNIPMAVLYDGEQYLLEKPYAIALLPNLQVFDLQSPTQRSLDRVLAAGVSDARFIEGREFLPLRYVTDEFDQIATVVPTTTLINAEFTVEHLQQELNSQPFSAIHIATHGSFSSDPNKTFILTYDELLKSSGWDSLLRTETQNRSTPIELMVLSACETAEGDNRATLGLAGIAVRAGTLSTLSTLWQVGDRSTAQLMGRFYNYLMQPNTTKAEALHQAQLDLFHQSGYRSPFIWSPYVLVGNWL